MPLDFLLALLFTNAFELPVTCFLLRSRERLRSVSCVVLASNLLTLPIVWFAFPLLPLPYAVRFFVSEAFAFGAESALYVHFFQNTNWRRAAVAAIAANMVSLLAGLLYF